MHINWNSCKMQFAVVDYYHSDVISPFYFLQEVKPDAEHINLKVMGAVS